MREEKPTVCEINTMPCFTIVVDILNKQIMVLITLNPPKI